MDAKILCSVIDEICATEEYDEKLRDVWEYLRPKIIKKVNYALLNNHPDVKNKVFDYIDKLKKDNIYILKKGELEDYVTSEGQKLIEDLGLSNQKELKVIKLAELIDNDEIEIEQVLDIGDYVEVIQNLIFNS